MDLLSSVLCKSVVTFIRQEFQTGMGWVNTPVISGTLETKAGESQGQSGQPSEILS